MEKIVPIKNAEGEVMLEGTLINTLDQNIAKDN
jgi:hypothetical protein